MLILSRYEKIFWFAAFALMVVVFVSFIPGYYQTCTDENTPKEHCASYSLAPFLAIQIYKILHTLEGAITALATFAIAYFTWTIREVNKSQLAHSHRVERAYVSGGGNRTQVFSHLSPNHEVVTKSGNDFVFRINNYGKTPGTVYKFGYGFCDETSIPAQPTYTFQYWREQILPGQSGQVLLLRSIPQQFTRPIVFGRFYYRTIFDTCHSSGFIYRILPDKQSEPITPPNNDYIQEQDENSDDADPI